MSAVVHALYRALRDIARPAVLRLFLRSMLLTLIAFLLAGGTVFWAVQRLMNTSGLFSADVQNLANVLVVLGILAASWLLFRGVSIFVIGLFADSIIEDIEHRHYPAAALTAVPVGFGRSVRMSLRSVGRFLGVNALALPVYIPLIPTGIGLPILALLINGWLLGYDLEEMVKARHLGASPLSVPQRWGLGLLSAASISIPIVNFLAPVLSTSMAVHLFHLRSKGNL